MVISDIATGALVAAGGSDFIIPGRKKLAGEMLWLVLMPPQPAPKNASAARIAKHRKFPFNLTRPL